VILVVGLGNPGPRYHATRHNVGWAVIDRLAARAGAPAFGSKFRGQFAKAELSGKPLGLLKPETYMNESGKSVQPAMQFFKLQPSAVLLVHDELDLGFGDVRLKQGGGDAGNRGVRSVTESIGPDTVRLRIGIGKPPPEFRGDTADFVLQGFAQTERTELDSVLDRAADAVVLVATQGISAAMNATNQRRPR
jgi:peptidyl-tRNA hydrolase, PTH1 family